MNPVSVRRETVVLPTYEPLPPDRLPMFLERRVYQGSSGRVYPLPFTDRIAEKPVPRAWDAVYLENDFILVMILPQLGGRIHRLLDKTNGYDALYHQPVIKPALVGLAGPWASGGIEFNWPQHHRPSTFLPTEVALEHEPDGAVTAWLSEHDPLARMKGMHGVRLRPGRSVLELRVRAYNRTRDTQTFLWWANAATRVHEAYQSFFPPDVTTVADHAKRATSTFPHCSGRYYGVDYATRARNGIPAAELPRAYRPPHTQSENQESKTENPPPAYRADDLSWYANIPVPTSYMIVGSRGDFFGGYDHTAQAGLLHVADHRIAPGKKQWTWGNHDFGYAWDRNLTDPDARGEFAPYIELMAGVFTDNQPDFSFLAPGETRTWTQAWYPIRGIGPAHEANLDAAVSLTVTGRDARLGVAVTAAHADACVRLYHGARVLLERRTALSPATPLVESLRLPRPLPADRLTVEVLADDGHPLLTYSPARWSQPAEPVQAATEPPPPADVPSTDELYVIGLHLAQYRHATRFPETYWREALRRDPGDARCHTALGRWHLHRGEFTEAIHHFQAAIGRLTSRNPNPADGEAHYQLGRCLALQAWASLDATATARLTGQARDALAKAAWNHGWQSAAHHALAELACRDRAWPAALDHLDQALRLNTDHLQARALKILVLRRLGRSAEADTLLADTRRLDPLDAWTRHLAGEPLACATQIRLDVALDCSRAGFDAEALAVLADAQPEPHSGTAPLLGYTRAWLCTRLGDPAAARRHLAAAAAASPDHCFPARLEEITLLTHAASANPRDARVWLYLGNLCYDRRRHTEALASWDRATTLEPGLAAAWRNLGLGACNVLQAPARARQCYEEACRAAPDDARLLYERDQLWKRLGETPARRLRVLERHPALVAARDDLIVELCTLYNQTGRPERARALLEARRFQPWEGGEGLVLAQHVRTHLLLGRAALARGDANLARAEFAAALAVPENLGEARHLLANASDIHFHLGEAHAALGDRAGAREHWTVAATFTGDFQDMSVRAYSEMTYYSALAWQRLGRRARADKLLRDLLAYARDLARSKAKIDYFATSLPALLLFTEDLNARQQTTALFLEAQARLGLGQRTAARRLLQQVLTRDPNHALAQDLTLSSFS